MSTPLKGPTRGSYLENAENAVVQRVVHESRVHKVGDSHELLFFLLRSHEVLSKNMHAQRVTPHDDSSLSMVDVSRQYLVAGFLEDFQQTLREEACLQLIANERIEELVCASHSSIHLPFSIHASTAIKSILLLCTQIKKERTIESQRSGAMDAARSTHDAAHLDDARSALLKARHGGKGLEALVADRD